MFCWPLLSNIPTIPKVIACDSNYSGVPCHA